MDYHSISYCDGDSPSYINAVGETVKSDLPPSTVEGDICAQPLQTADRDRSFDHITHYELAYLSRKDMPSPARILPKTTFLPAVDFGTTGWASIQLPNTETNHSIQNFNDTGIPYFASQFISSIGVPRPVHSVSQHEVVCNCPRLLPFQVCVFVHEQ